MVLSFLVHRSDSEQYQMAWELPATMGALIRFQQTICITLFPVHGLAAIEQSKRLYSGKRTNHCHLHSNDWIDPRNGGIEQSVYHTPNR